jgi:hypothetical protein
MIRPRKEVVDLIEWMDHQFKLLGETAEKKKVTELLREK